MRRAVVVLAAWMVLCAVAEAQTTIHWKRDYIRDANGVVVATAEPKPSDETPPTAPSGLVHTNVTETSVTLSWTDSTDSGGSGLAGYKLYRQLGTSNVLAAAISSSYTSYTDLPLLPATEYTYTVRAFDNAGNHSSASGEDELTTLVNLDDAAWRRVGGDGIDSSWGSGYETVRVMTMLSGKLYVGLSDSADDAEVWEYDPATRTWAKVGGDSVNSSWGSGYERVSALITLSGKLYAGLGLNPGDAEFWEYNPGSTTWTKVGGDTVNSSWGSYNQVIGVAVISGQIYAGLRSATPDAEVWKYDPGSTTWTKVGGDGVNSSWSSGFEGTRDLEVIGNDLYASLGESTNDAEVWKFNTGSSTWSKVGGDGVNSSWSSGYELAENLAVLNGKLYAGIGDDTGDAEVWEFTTTGPTWTKVGGDGTNSSWNTNYENVRGLQVFNGRLYAGIGDSAGDAEVWRYTPGGSWTKFAGDGLNSSWGTGYELAWGFAPDEANGRLYVGLGSSSGDAEVFEIDEATVPIWQQIGGDAVNSSWSTNYETVTRLEVMDGTIYAGLGSSSGDAEVWKFDPSQNLWTQIGGDGISSSWAASGNESVGVLYAASNGKLYASQRNATPDGELWEYTPTTGTWAKVGGDGVNSSWGTSVYDAVNGIGEFAGKLVVGLGINNDDADVWQWDFSTTWTKIGGDGVNSSWGTGYDQVTAIVLFGGNLYASLGVDTGDGEVWKWNGTAWSKAGGDGLNSSWTSELVTSLAVHDSKLYAGIGLLNAGDAEVWEFNGTSWTKIGGDGVNSSWNTNYERARTLVSHGGKLYAGLAASTGDAEVWEYNGTSWTKVGGDGMNASWVNSAFEHAASLLSTPDGLVVGLGISTGNADVWRYTQP